MIAVCPPPRAFVSASELLPGPTVQPPSLEAAHLMRCASPMRFRAAALIFRRFRFGGPGVAAGSAEPPSQQAAEFGDLGIKLLFLSFHSQNRSIQNLSRNFRRRHVADRKSTRLNSSH